MPARTMATTWHWSQIAWPLRQSQTMVGLIIDVPGAEGYFSTYDAIDDRGFPVEPTYYIGDAGHVRRVASQGDALARLCIFASADKWRFDDPPCCRYVRVYHRSIDGSAYIIRELFPLRLSADQAL